MFEVGQFLILMKCAYYSVVGMLRGAIILVNRISITSNSSVLMMVQLAICMLCILIPEKTMIG